METDHIVPAAESHDHSIKNAIPVCFECHAEIHSYNPKHPRGRKFTADELRGHKEQWLEICANRPEVFINAARNADVGPLQALIDELEFNGVVADDAVAKHATSSYFVGCTFHVEQFLRAIREGSISMLQDNLKRSILEAYRAIGHANHSMNAITVGARIDEQNTAKLAVHEAKGKIHEAHDALLQFLGSER
jgi:hypothetical protein